MNIKTAREFMSNELQDEDLRHGYRANIAMLIHDDQISELPTNLNTKEGCNSVADRLIDLIFN